MKKQFALSVIIGLLSMSVFASNVIEKKTMRYLKSVHTPLYDNENYIINPVLPKCDKKYWVIKENQVVEMTEAEKAIKNTELAIALDVKNQAIQVANEAKEREALIQARMRKIAEEQLISEGVIDIVETPILDNVTIDTDTQTHVTEESVLEIISIKTHTITNVTTEAK